jgi:ABC-2 type transport system ATP-binding protein
MKQRLALGRALIHDPAVLVLDEPAAGLDPRARIELRDMIRKLATHGKTVLVSSHILTELAEICDMVGIIECGRLLAVGSVDEIQSRHEDPRSLVEVKLLGDAASLATWLSERETMENLTVDGQSLRFSHRGRPEDNAALLREMIEAGFDVLAFGAKQQSLEDVFLRVTQGLVQ